MKTVKLIAATTFVIILVNAFISKLSEFINFTLFEYGGLAMSLTCLALLFVINSEVITDEL